MYLFKSSNIAILLFTLILIGSCIQFQSEDKEITASRQSLPEFNYLEGAEFTVLEDDTLLVLKHPQNKTVYNRISVNKDIELPLERVVVFSATHVPYFELLNSLDYIKGMAHPEYSLSDSLIFLLKNKLLKDVTGAREADFEKTISCEPDAIMVFPFGAQDHSSYTELGISVLNITEYLEKHPLGKAEWLKVFGYLIGRQDLAASKFNAIEKKYLELKENTTKTGLTAFTGEPFKSQWNQPSGSSYMSHILSDAGLNYLWKDSLIDKNLEFTFEEVYNDAIDADYWFIAAPKPEDYSLKHLIAEDERFEKLKSVRDGNVYLCNTAEVDYFGIGSVSPHIILSDLINAVQHNKSGTFFKKLD